MVTFLHLLKADASPLALPVIEQSHREPGARITVVLLAGGAPPALPDGITVRRLAAGDLDYSALLDLIFESDHVIAW